jgi:AcrR family transcriptional regulator
MTQRVEGKQKRALETRKKIMSAYEKLAADKCFDEISIDEIARVAGVGKGTVLAHFSEKLALPAELFARRLSIIRAAIEAQDEGRFDLKSTLLQLLDFVFTDDVYARIVLWEGYEICAALIEPEEEKLFAAIGKFLPQKSDQKVYFDLIRALLVNAVVMHRACMDQSEARVQFEQLFDSFAAQ